MARQISEIKLDMTSSFVTDPTIVEKYDLDPEKTFDEQFSKVSLESILFYIIASAVWVLETLFDRHKLEVMNFIDNYKPHSLRWYVNKTKQFRAGQLLLPDSDKYSDISPETGLEYTDGQIEKMQVVKYASANELSGVLYIKIAGGTDEKREPLEDKYHHGVEEYLSEIKDAGVRVFVQNEKPDIIRVDLLIYYNPMILTDEGTSVVNGGNPVIECINKYIANLPFNGELRNTVLINELQKVEGVVIPQLNCVTTRFARKDSETDDDYKRRFQIVNAKETPYSGYYEFDKKESSIKYIAYESVSA